MNTHATNQNHGNQRSTARHGGTRAAQRSPIALVFALAAILAVIGLSSCAGYTSASTPAGGSPGSPGAGILTPGAPTLAFGNVSLGTSATQTLAVTNTGTATVNIDSVSISGAGFTATGGSPLSALGVGQTGTIQIQFAPTSAGAVTGSVSITSNASNSPSTISLSGTGTSAPEPQLSASPAIVNFGNVIVGSNGSQKITLSNSGNASVTITQANATGAGYSTTGLSLPQTIVAGGNATFNVVFAPTTAGAASGSVSLVSNAPNSPLAISLSGTGTAASQPQLSATPTSASFGNVTVGSNASQTITLSNGGNANVTITQANATGAGYSTTGLSLPQTIAAGGKATFNVMFAPATAGAASGSVSLVSNAPNSPLAISLSGTGMAASTLLGANPTTLTFGNVTDGSNSSSNVTLQNNGNTNVTISSVTVTGAGMSTSGVSSGLTLTPNQTATLSVTFAPNTAGAVSGSVTVASNATNSPAMISVSGTGVAPSSHSVGLSWDASTSTDVVGYFVYRGAVSGGPYTKQNSSADANLAYTDSAVASGQTYFYVVTAVDSSNVESAYSNEVSAVIP
jgi:hypothetical protein